MTQLVRFEELPVDAQQRVRDLHHEVHAGRYKQAVGGLARLVAEHPGYVVGHVMLGKALRMSGQLEWSHKVFDGASRFAGDDAGVRLGLAWGHLDAGRLDAASECARRATEHPTYKGDALAVVARVHEARGETQAAAQAFLAAYQANPMTPWLREHCAMAGRPFLASPGARDLAWTITPAQRLSLYRFVENCLLGVAQQRGLSTDPSTVLAAACDHSPCWTTAWARRWNVDVVDLYQRLISRGGFCDCEVLLNAAQRDDTDLEVVVVAGRVAGDGKALFDALRGSLRRGKAPESVDLDSRGEDGELERAVASVRKRGLDLPLQRVHGALLADVLNDLPAALEAEDAAELLLLYPDANPVAERVVIRANAWSFEPIPSLAPSPGYPEESTGKADRAVTWRVETVARFAGLVPVADGWTTEGRLELLEGRTGRLLGTGPEAWRVWLADGSGGAALDVAGSSLVIAPGGSHAAWLGAFRTKQRLVVEDRREGVRRSIACDRFGPSMAFSADATELYVVRDGRLVAIDLATLEARELCPATSVAASPVDRRLAVTLSDSTFAVVDGRGSVAMPPRSGRSVAWSPDGEHVAYLCAVDGEREQVYVADTRSWRARRVSPDCREACWPSFTDGGRSIVAYLLLTRDRVPIADGRFRVVDDEALVKCGVEEAGEAEELWSSRGQYMRIAAPLAHPTRPWVAFRTQDAPNQGVRLVVWVGGQLRALGEGRSRPVQWLPDEGV